MGQTANTHTLEGFGAGRPSHGEISVRAYELYLGRGAVDGGAEDDWLQAERELLNLRTEEDSAPRKRITARRHLTQPDLASK